MEGICLKIYNLSCEYAKKVREKSNIILKEHGMELPPPIPMQTTRKVWCYPVQFAIGCPRLPVVEYLPERDQAMLRFQGDTLAINTNYLQKLVRHKFKFGSIEFELNSSYFFRNIYIVIVVSMIGNSNCLYHAYG